MLQKKYTSIHDWVGKVIHCDFEIQIDPLIPARRSGLVIIYRKKRTCRIVYFAISADYKVL